MRFRTLPIVAAALALGACVSVPRDAGLSDVNQLVSQRSTQQITIVERTGPPPSIGGVVEIDRAVAYAIDNSPRLQIAIADLGVARAELIEASTIANPLFEFEIRFPGDPYRPYEFRLAQSLIDLAFLPRRRALGRAMFESAKLEASAAVLEFAGDVRSQYYEAVAANQILENMRVHAEAAAAGAELALAQHHAGTITDMDLENEQALYEQAKLDLAAAEERVIVARESLTRSMGLRESTGWSVSPEFPPLPDADLDATRATELARQNRLDVAIARRELEIAERRSPIARAEAFGEVEVDVHHEREPDGAKSTGPGIEFPIPIFNRGRAARARAEAEINRARAKLNAVEIEAASLTRVAQQRLAASRARVEYMREVVVPRRERITSLTQLEYNGMLVGVFQLIQAKQNEMQAKRDFVDAQRDYWTARNDLDRAINGIAADTAFRPATTQSSEPAAGRGGH